MALSGSEVEEGGITPTAGPQGLTTPRALGHNATFSFPGRFRADPAGAERTSYA